jgi:hypothetical protein
MRRWKVIKIIRPIGKRKNPRIVFDTESGYLIFDTVNGVLVKGTKD